jgi:hypothetical protein
MYKSLRMKETKTSDNDPHKEEQVYLCLNKHFVNSDIVILDLRGRWVVITCSWLINFRYFFSRRVNVFQNWSWRFEEERRLFPLLGIQILFLGCPASSLAIILPDL